MSIMKKTSIALVIAGLLSSTALADGGHHHASGSTSRDTGKTEGQAVVKIRGGYLHTNIKNKASAGYSSKHHKTTHGGYAAELALGYFFTDNIALEGSVAYNKSALNLSTIPLSLLVQYHFLPEASVSPYVGVGYSYKFVSSSPKNNKYENAGGVVGQVGLDIPYNDTIGFNVEAKYTYQASHKAKVKGVKAGTAKSSTTAVTAGVTFSF
jgi:outer membrane protein